MRKAQFGDAFKVIRIINHANLKDVLQAKIIAYNEQSKETTEEEKGVIQSNIGVDIALTIIATASSPQIETLVYDLLSGLFEIEPIKVKELEFDELILKIKKLIELNDLKVFFEEVSRLMQLTSKTYS